MQEERPLTVRCACGWETVGSEDEVVAATQKHGRRIHNMLPTRDEVLAMVVGSADEEPGADRFVVGLTSPEIGEQLRLTPEGVRSRLRRALERLRKELDRWRILTTTSLPSPSIAMSSITSPPEIHPGSRSRS